MIDSGQHELAAPARRRCVSVLAMLTAAATLGFVVSLAAIALAGGAAVTVGSASNATLGEQLLVSPQGRTLYVLSPETTRHLLCKTSECLKFWPPLTVRSRTTRLQAAAGVHGHLGILRRSNGMLQVTLNGRPLYRFAEDHANGEVNGQNFKSFGGTWHVLTTSGSPSARMPPGASAPTGNEPSYPVASPTPASSTPASGSSSSSGWEY